MRQHGAAILTPKHAGLGQVRRDHDLESAIRIQMYVLRTYYRVDEMKP